MAKALTIAQMIEKNKSQYIKDYLTFLSFLASVLSRSIKMVSSPARTGWSTF